MKYEPDLIQKPLDFTKTKLLTPVWVDGWTMTNNGKYLQVRGSRTPLATVAFNNENYHQTELHTGKKPILASAFVMGKIQTVCGMVFNPLKGDIFNSIDGKVVNLYREHKHVIEYDENKARNIIITHLEHLLTDTQDRKLIFDWMAHQVQNPGKLVRFIPTIVGTQGDGKTTLYEMIDRALGLGNTLVIDQDDLMNSQFNDWSNNGAVASIEEIRLEGKDKYKIYNKMKPFITNQTISVKRKHLPVVNANNVTNYIAFSNFKDCIPLSEADRRFWVLFTSYVDAGLFDKEGFAPYFQELYAYLDSPEGAAGIYHALKNHLISEEFKELNGAPDTNAKELMKIETFGSGTLAIIERLESQGDKVLTKEGDHLLLNITKLQQITRDMWHRDEAHWQYERMPTGKSLNYALDELGYKLHKRLRNTNTKVLERFYISKKPHPTNYFISSDDPEGDAAREAAEEKEWEEYFN